MFGGHADPDGDLADRHPPDSMHTRGPADGKSPAGLADDALAFLRCKRAIDFILQRAHLPATAATAYAALKRHKATCADIRQLPA